MPSRQPASPFLLKLLRKTVATKIVLAALRAVATKELKSTGKFTVPGLVTFKAETQPRPRRRANEKMIDKVIMEKVKPANKVIQCFVMGLKRSIAAGQRQRVRGPSSARGKSRSSASMWAR